MLRRKGEGRRQLTNAAACGLVRCIKWGGHARAANARSQITENRSRAGLVAASRTNPASSSRVLLALTMVICCPREAAADCAALISISAFGLLGFMR
jgi:hypothetical protein